MNSPVQKQPSGFIPFVGDPDAIIRRLDAHSAIRTRDLVTGAIIMGATGSGKTSGPLRFLATGMLSAGWGGLINCSKPEEPQIWINYAKEAGRLQDVVLVDSIGNHRYNFLDEESSRDASEGGGLAINIVDFLMNLAGAISKGAGGQEDVQGDQFWKDALKFLLFMLTGLLLLANVKISLPLMRSVVNSAPLTPQQVADKAWQQESICWQLIHEADTHTASGDPENRADFEEVKNYFLREFPNLSDRTRSIVILMFSMLVHPLITRPMRKIFCTDTNIRPQDIFDGKIVIVALPTQQWKTAGLLANLAFKYAFQISALRRIKPAQGFLRPVFNYCDEAQGFITDHDPVYAALARSASAASIFGTQNRESFKSALGKDAAVDSFLANMQLKIWCNNAGPTNEWASELLGERYLGITTINAGRSGNESIFQLPEHRQHNSGISRKEEKRRYLEPSAFTTLRRGGALFDYCVDAVVYNGGHLFCDGSEHLPYKIVTFKQK